MTRSVSESPTLRLTYRRARYVKMADRYVKGVLISAEDVRVLRLLSARNLLVRLESPGLPTYHAHIHQLLKRVVPVPGTDMWYVPTTVTGPLRQAGPEI